MSFAVEWTLLMVIAGLLVVVLWALDVRYDARADAARRTKRGPADTITSIPRSVCIPTAFRRRNN